MKALILFSFFALIRTSAFAVENLALPINFSSVTPQIYRGARPESDLQVQALRQAGIRTVIDLQGGDYDDMGPVAPLFEKGETPADIENEGREVSKAGMLFVSRPLHSFGQLTYTEADDLGNILKMMNDPQLQPVYVHCAFGVDRTGLVVALYRVLYQNWQPLKAYQEMYDHGHQGVHLATYRLDEIFWGIVATKELYH